MDVDERLSAAVLTYVGYDGVSAIPGHHPERIVDQEIRDRARAIVSFVNEKTPSSQGLSQWGMELRAEIHDEHPELNNDAVTALVALLTFQWR